VTIFQATAAMLLSDCSARQQAATDEVEKAKVELQELQVRCEGAGCLKKCHAIASFWRDSLQQEQIRKHQLELKSLLQDVAVATSHSEYLKVLSAASKLVSSVN
jgi:hypothetical protein